MFGLAIHGGAGTLPRAEMTGDREQLYRAGLASALDSGFAVLEAGSDLGEENVVVLKVGVARGDFRNRLLLPWLKGNGMLVEVGHGD